MDEIDFLPHDRIKAEEERIRNIKRGIRQEEAKEKPDFVRLGTLRRNLRGAEDVAHLVEVEDAEREKRLKLADEVSWLGRDNHSKAVAAAIEARRVAAREELAALQDVAEVEPTADEMRDYIQEKTGKRPHHRVSLTNLKNKYQVLRSKE